MVLYFLAYVLFMLGAVLALINSGYELSLWFIGLGWVLEVTLNLLVWLKSPKVLRLARDGWQKAAHILALMVIPVMMIFRIKADLRPFMLLLILAVILWSLSLINLKRSHPGSMEVS